MPLLHLLHLPVLIAQLCLPVIKFLLRDLPKGIDLILLRQDMMVAVRCEHWHIEGTVTLSSPWEKLNPDALALAACSCGTPPLCSSPSPMCQFFG